MRSTETEAYWKEVPGDKLYVFADKIIDLNLNYESSDPPDDVDLEAGGRLHHVVVQAVALVVMIAEKVAGQRQPVEGAHVGSDDPAGLTDVFPVAKGIAQVDARRDSPCRRQLLRPAPPQAPAQAPARPAAYRSSARTTRHGAPRS